MSYGSVPFPPRGSCAPLASKGERPRLSLIIPTYNERGNIVALIKRVRGVLRQTGLTFEIIVVDDDSPDRTWQAAQTLAGEYPCLRVVRRINERGLARAVIRGWHEARGEWLAVMDGDLQHPPETLALLVKAIAQDEADIAVASRNVRGGGVSRWSPIRRGISWLATLAATWTFPATLAAVRDPMSGYFALRRSVIEGRALKPEGYKILLEVLVRGRYRTVVEIPYIFVERKRGGSKMGPRQYFQFIMQLVRLSWQAGETTRRAAPLLRRSSKAAGMTASSMSRLKHPAIKRS